MAEEKSTTPEPTKPTTSLFNFFGTSKPVELPKNKGEPKHTSKKGYVTRSTRKIATKLLSMKHKIVGIMNTTINDLVHKMDCKPKMVRKTRKRKNIAAEEPAIIATEEEAMVETPVEEEVVEEQEEVVEEGEPVVEEQVMGTEEPSVLEQGEEEKLEIGGPKVSGGKRRQKKLSKRKYPKK
jgi:hypothetical protein